MEPKAHHVLIGLFTLAAIAGGLYFALWLSASDDDQDYTYYEIVFQEGVNGLSEGNPVKYSGIRVGDVAGLRLDPKDPRNVRALVRVLSHVPIRENTRAGLAITNITGSMSVALEGGTPDRPILEGSRTDPPIIYAEPSALNSLMTTSEDLLDKLDRILINTNRVMSDQNIANLTQSLSNLEALSSALMGKRDQANAVVKQLEEFTREIRTTLNIFKQIGRKSNALLENSVEPLLTSAQTATQTLTQATARIDRLLADNEKALGLGMQGVSELAPTLRGLRATLSNLNGLIERLEDDPAGLLLGNEPLEEFQP